MINIGNSSIHWATAYPNHRKLLKTSTGTLVLFAYLGDGIGTEKRIQYKISTDGGDTWGSWNDINWGRNCRGDGNFDVIIDSSDNIHVAACDGNSLNIYYAKLTYQGSNTWSHGTPTSIGEGGYYVSMAFRSNGDLYIASSGYRSQTVYVFYYNGSSWQSSSFSITPRMRELKAFAVGSNIMVVYTGDTTERLNYRIGYGSTWSDETTIVNDYVGYMSGVKISDSEIYLLVRANAALTVFKYNGSTWDSGTVLSSNSTTYTTMTNVGNKPVAIWVEYANNQYDIVYRKWNGSTWESKVNITNDSTIERYPTALEEDSEFLHLIWTSGSSSPYNIYYHKISLNPTKQKTIQSDAHIKATGIQETIQSDAHITASIRKTIQSDAHIKVTGIQETIESDAFIVKRLQETIQSDAHIKATGIQETIQSDAAILAEATYDVINEITFTKQPLIDIANNAIFVRRVLDNVYNYINTVKSFYFNINNDVRTKKQNKYNIQNDIRFLKSFQKGDYGFQSMGKQYIKVYIDGVEQTDVNVDSIRIYKAESQEHTASFDLARLYDSSKPDLESTVTIKYCDWVIYKGYITSINPSDNPEHINIFCKDEFWKKNKTNKYFFVGHQPSDEKEKYYSTISEAIQNEYGLNLPLGNFIPEVINCFGEKYSDVLVKLVQEAGNFGVYYDTDGNIKLIKHGEGNIINIPRQEFGQNLGLYQVISHTGSVDASNIVNKLRVQMGEKVVRTFNTSGGTRTYSGYRYRHYEGFATPAWNRSLEVLSKDSSSGYGWDYHPPYDDDAYVDVFRKYNLPYLDPKLGSWSDDKPPYVEIYAPGSYCGYPYKIITEGFTIDYENRQIIFDDPMWFYRTNSHGEIIAIRGATVKVHIWKKEYYTHTSTPDENPEETPESNPLVFVTEKVGTYPDTIVGILNLPQLSVQEGGYTLDENGNIAEFYPSWDDTEFAEDLAYWQLSKTAYEKERIDIEITLDAALFYGVSLDKRIEINGITNGAFNITSIDYDINNFIVKIGLEKLYPYTRTVSLPSRGE